MAKRFGGTYSPSSSQSDTSRRTKKQSNPFSKQKPARAGARSNILFFMPLILIFKIFQSDPILMAQYLIALFCMISAAYFTHEGLKAQDAFESRKIARPPAIPRKIFASLLMGAGLGIVGFAGYGALEGLIFALIGAILHSLSFGIDPLKKKGIEGGDRLQEERVNKVVIEAEKHLNEMRDALQRLHDRAAYNRFEDFTATVRDMLTIVEEDPRDLSSARKYLGVYLQGAKAATFKFAALYERTQDATARSDWMRLLDDLEDSYTQQNQALLSDNKTDLEIEIDVLRERLAREN